MAESTITALRHDFRRWDIVNLSHAAGSKLPSTTVVVHVTGDSFTVDDAWWRLLAARALSLAARVKRWTRKLWWKVAGNG